MSNLLTIILAAGQGTRMKSKLLKVLHPLAGKNMIKHVINSVEDLSDEMVLVIGYQGEKIKNSINSKHNIHFVEQKEQLGTGHAVLQVEKHLKNWQGSVLIICGDTPLLRQETLQELVKEKERKKAGAVVLTANLAKPAAYGRIVRKENGDILKIVEAKDASQKELLIKEINSGVYCLDSKLLLEGLASLDCNNAQGEYYLTDVLQYINSKGDRVIPLVVEDEQEIIGVNDRKYLSLAEKILRQRIINYHLEQGVTIIDPATTYIDSEVEIANDTTIYPFSFLEGKTKVGSDTIVGPYCHLVDTIIGEKVVLKDNCKIYDSKVADKATIGPFAYIRPGCNIGEKAKVGDFVELKKTKIGSGTKVPHLSYVGDANLGANCNIGAGTIFANYDGKNKHQTTLADSVFIGSNTTLVAPVKIGEKAKTGAGAVVTKDVATKTTVVGVPARPLKKKKKRKGDT